MIFNLNFPQRPWLSILFFVLFFFFKIANFKRDYLDKDNDSEFTAKTQSTRFSWIFRIYINYAKTFFFTKNTFFFTKNIFFITNTFFFTKIQGGPKKTGFYANFSENFFRKIFFAKTAYIGLKSCEKSIARIPEAWKCFLDPDSGK